MWDLLHRSGSSLLKWRQRGNCCVSRSNLAVRRWAGKQKDLGSIRFGSPLSSKIVVNGHLSSDFAYTVNETLRCLTQLPVLFVQSHSGGDSEASRW